MGCNSTKSQQEKVYHVAPEADPTNMTSPDIVYKPEQVSLDGRANDERRRENLICRVLASEANINNDNGKCFNNSAAVDSMTEQHYLMSNSVNANNGYITQRSTYYNTSHGEVQPLINGQSVDFNNVVSNNVNNGELTSRFIQSRTWQLTPVTEHIIVNFQSTNNKINEASTEIKGQTNNLDRNYEYGRSDDANKYDDINNKNMTAVHSLSSQPIIEVCDVINTFQPCPDNEYCDSDIVVIPTPQTVLKTRS